jgi:hypothetical protein
MQKVYLLCLMPICVRLIIFATSFCHSCLSQVDYNCSLIKLDWLDGCRGRVGPEIDTFLDPEMATSAAKYRGNSPKIRSMGKSEEFGKMAKSHFR